MLLQQKTRSTNPTYLVANPFLGLIDPGEGGGDFHNDMVMMVGPNISSPKCLLLGCYFAKFGIAIVGFHPEPKLHKFGAFLANYGKKHPI